MRTRFNLARTCGLGALSLLAACSIVLDTDRHRSDVVPIAATEFCAELAEISCSALQDCCADPAIDFQGCIDIVGPQCAQSFGALGINPRTGYDPAVAGLALGEARRLAAECAPSFEAWSNSPQGLQRILTGTVPLGEPCEPLVANLPNVFTCADDGVCTQLGNLLDPDWRCVPLSPQGGPCTVDFGCEPGLRCTVDIQFYTLPGTCEPLKPNGELCGRDTECESYYCDSTCRAPTVDTAYCEG